MIKLIGLDLDGTVFDDRKNISPETRNAVGQAAARGVFIVPVTGRPLKAIPESVLELPGVRYICATSGACIYDQREKIKVHEDLIANKVAVEILSRLLRNGCVTMAFVDGMGYVEHEDLKRALLYAKNDVVRYYLTSTRDAVDQLPFYINRDGRGVEKITVTFPQGVTGDILQVSGVKDILTDYSDEIDFVCGESIGLEATNKTATKGNALRFLAKMHGIRTDEMMACGDSENDIDMLEAVGLPVAMGNAAEIVKKAASFVTKSNEEDGVAYAIKKYVLSDEPER